MGVGGVILRLQALSTLRDLRHQFNGKLLWCPESEVCFMDFAAPQLVRAAKSMKLLGQSIRNTRHPLVYRISDSVH